MMTTDIKFMPAIIRKKKSIDHKIDLMNKNLSDN